MDQVVRQLRAPKPEKLRVLILGASAEGDLRIGRDQKRIRAAVASAWHRDQIDLDVRPAATTADLLDEITKFRPHMVHFSGHSNEALILFEDEQDEPHERVIVTARAFARAIEATDDPPLLVLLNSCRSAAQVDDLVAQVAPFAIGMADSIEDGDAINFAAQFYGFSTIFQYESFRITFPSRNSQWSHPRTRTGTPSAIVPVNVHSDTPILPLTQCRASP